MPSPCRGATPLTSEKSNPRPGQRVWRLAAGRSTMNGGTCSTNSPCAVPSGINAGPAKSRLNATRFFESRPAKSSHGNGRSSVKRADLSLAAWRVWRKRCRESWRPGACRACVIVASRAEREKENRFSRFRGVWDVATRNRGKTDRLPTDQSSSLQSARLLDPRG